MDSYLLYIGVQNLSFPSEIYLISINVRLSGHYRGLYYLFRSHKSPVENMKWLPKNVWFSQESAFPKVNQDEDNRQFITCAAEMFILVWDFLKPSSEGGDR